MAIEDRKVRMVGQPRPLTPLIEDLLTKVQGEAGKMLLQHSPLIIASYPLSSFRMTDCELACKNHS